MDAFAATIDVILRTRTWRAARDRKEGCGLQPGGCLASTAPPLTPSGGFMGATTEAVLNAQANNPYYRITAVVLPALATVTAAI